LLLLAFLGELWYTATDFEQSLEQQDRKIELILPFAGGQQKWEKGRPISPIGFTRRSEAAGSGPGFSLFSDR
jgi:hypothetical protein